MNLKRALYLAIILFSCTLAWFLFVPRTITQDKAIQIVKDKFEKDTKYQPIQIHSVTLKDGVYEIKWTRDINCEGGTEKVDAKTGESEGTEYIC